MKRVGETGRFSHLFYQFAGLLQLFSGMIHFKPQQILVWALMIVALEKAAQIGIVDMALRRDLCQGPKLQTIFFKILAALLISGESQGLRCRQRSAGAFDAKGKAFQQFGAQVRALPARLQPDVDEFIKERLQGKRWEGF